MWECGLKLCGYMFDTDTDVTPYVGVWIETVPADKRGKANSVTPYVGVWIETIKRFSIMTDIQSLLMWECGLKQ